MRKPAPPREIPPPLELECLRVLWKRKEANVQQVRSALRDGNRALAYTTVLTVLDRLVRRGAVQRRKQGRAFYYSAVLGIDRARQAAVQELVDTYFFGSIEDLRDYLGSIRSEPALTLDVNEGAPSLDTTLL